VRERARLSRRLKPECWERKRMALVEDVGGRMSRTWPEDITASLDTLILCPLPPRGLINPSWLLPIWGATEGM